MAKLCNHEFIITYYYIGCSNIIPLLPIVTIITYHYVLESGQLAYGTQGLIEFHQLFGSNFGILGMIYVHDFYSLSEFMQCVSGQYAERQLGRPECSGRLLFEGVPVRGAGLHLRVEGWRGPDEPEPARRYPYFFDCRRRRYAAEPAEGDPCHA